jgi:hypothetical protein
MKGFFMPNARELSPDDNYLFVNPWIHLRHHHGPVGTDARFVGGWKKPSIGSVAPADQRAVRP